MKRLGQRGLGLLWNDHALGFRCARTGSQLSRGQRLHTANLTRSGRGPQISRVREHWKADHQGQRHGGPWQGRGPGGRRGTYTTHKTAQGTASRAACKMRETHISGNTAPSGWTVRGQSSHVAGNDTEGGSPAQVKGAPSLQ